MKISESKFADLKARFEKYFQAVPPQIWFTGRKDAPSPTRQTHAVQQMFGIDLSAVGGDPVPELEDHIQSRRNRELKVAISRLEQWEFQQMLASMRRNVADRALLIEDLELSCRVYNCLKNAGITYVSELAGVTEKELLRIKHFGSTSLNELKEVLAQVGIQLKSQTPPVALDSVLQSDFDAVVTGIKKLPEKEAREVSLCLLNLLLPFTVNNQAATDLLHHFRDKLLGS